MPSALLAAYALCSLPLVLQPQEFLPDVTWPTHATIAVPRGSIKPTDRQCILENDRPIVAQVEVVAKWPDGSPKWLHAYASFRYIGGKPAKYVLTNGPKPPDNVPNSPLTISDDAGGIRINTGVVSFFIPRPFAGITMARQGEETVLDGPGGPSLVDDRGIVWQAVHDERAEVIVEQRGPAQVTVKASGWYQTAERRAEPFCRFVTRITAFAGSPIIKIDHATIFADDMRQHAIAELAFKFALPGAKRFSSGTLVGNFRKDLSAIWFAQVSADRLLTLVEHAPHGPVKVKTSGAQAHSPGWFSAELANTRVALLTKDFWQKCPKEIKITPDEISYYAWPQHGELAKPDETATRPEGVYKFQCFLTGRLLDSRLPSEYFAALEAQTDTTECKAEFARAANLEGVTMHNEFALALLPAAGSSRDNRHLEKLERLYAQSPIATADPATIAASGALGPVAATGPEFPQIQQAVRDGMLGYAHSIERWGDYGWCIYGNTHSEELMNPGAAGVPGGRPSLHRVWDNNHYQHVSTSWRLFALDGNPKLLDWARICTDNYASIGQVRYDSLKGRTDGRNQHQPGSQVKWHQPGAFWHCKAFVPWGCRDYGMDKNDSDSGLVGHWPDPSGLLFAWLVDANRWAKDGYDLWLNNVKFTTSGGRREGNTTLVHAITAYEYEPRGETLAAIKGIAHGLMSEPILKAHPGPIWEPTWLSRYHELFPDDEAFNKYIIESADSIGTGAEAIWSLALCATAYRITKNEEYLRRHAGTLASVPRCVFHDPAPDKRWDLYGFGPGPGYDGHFMLQWHRFSAALKDAKIDSLAAPDEPGIYFCGPSVFNNRDSVARNGTKILIWKDQEPTTLNVQANSLSSGDMHSTSLRLLSPKKQTLLNIPCLDMSTPSAPHVRATPTSTRDVWVENYPVQSAEPGLYTVLIGSHQIGVFQPLTKYPECQVLRTSMRGNSADRSSLLAKLTRGYLVALTTGKIRLTFSAEGTRDGSYVSIRGPQGQVVLSRYLRAGDSVNATLNEPGGPSGPWLLDAFSRNTGYFKLTIASDAAEPLLYGRRLEDLQWIRQKLGK